MDQSNCWELRISSSPGMNVEVAYCNPCKRIRLRNSAPLISDTEIHRNKVNLVQCDFLIRTSWFCKRKDFLFVNFYWNKASQENIELLKNLGTSQRLVFIVVYFTWTLWIFNTYTFRISIKSILAYTAWCTHFPCTWNWINTTFLTSWLAIKLTLCIFFI